MSLVFILGGARSGKSTYAQELALKSEEPVLFVATAQPGDEEMRRRIARHRAERPSSWRTLESATGVAGSVRQNIAGARTVVIDCIALLVNNIFMANMSPENVLDEETIEKAVMEEVHGLAGCMEEHPAKYIIVSNEVGLGLVPDNEMGRLYRDVLGKANQALARHAGEVYYLAAGIPLKIKPHGSAG